MTELEISGDEEAIRTLTEANLSFAKLIPEPGDPDDPEYDWYNWRLANWGVKWDLRVGAPESEWEFEPNRIYGFFETPWCAPVAGVIQLARRYRVAITLRYSQDGEFGYLSVQGDREPRHKMGRYRDYPTLLEAVRDVGAWMGRFQDSLDSELEYWAED
jgi:hypothetical protein